VRIWDSTRGYGVPPSPSPDRRFESSRLRISLGVVLRQGGRCREAESPLRQGLATLKDLMAEHPDAQGYRREAVGAWLELGRCFEGSDRAAAAEDAYRRALGLQQELAMRSDDTEQKHGLIGAHAVLGRFLNNHGRFLEAAEHYSRFWRYRPRIRP
jgi:tetratricopeptide (TPR) repeat protein